MLKKFLVCTLLLTAFCTNAQNNSLIYRGQALCLGNNPASTSYQDKVHEFLGYLQIDEPIPVLQMEPLAFVDAFLDSSTLLGFTTIDGIWLNEARLNKASEAERLFTIAHEAAHFALKHPRAILSDYAYAGVCSLGLFCALNCWDRAHQERGCISSTLQLTVRTAKSGCLIAAIYSFLFASRIQKNIISAEKEADLMAAKILWEHGYQPIVIQHVKELKALIVRGLGHANDAYHPSLVEEYCYLSAFLKERGTFTA